VDSKEAAVNDESELGETQIEAQRRAFSEKLEKPPRREGGL
jgi:hypothetical protein